MNREADQQPPPAEVARELDLKGLNCPLPILRTKLALAELAPGDVVHVLATDPHSVVDFKAFCARTGHRLVHYLPGPEVFEFWVERHGGR